MKLILLLAAIYTLILYQSSKHRVADALLVQKAGKKVLPAPRPGTAITPAGNKENSVSAFTTSASAYWLLMTGLSKKTFYPGPVIKD